MPLFIQHTYPSYKWGVWKMDETLDELLNMLPQQETYLEGLQRFSAEHRRVAVGSCVAVHSIGRGKGNCLLSQREAVSGR